MKKSKFFWAVPMAVLAVLISLLVINFTGEENKDSKLQTASVTSREKRLYYDNIDVTNLLPDKNNFEITNELRLRILNLIGNEFKPELYSRNEGKDSFFGGVNVGHYKKVADIDLNKIKEILNFNKSDVQIKNELVGRKETRKVISILCNKIFEYLACLENNKIETSYTKIGEELEGEKPSMLLDSKNIALIQHNYPSLVSEITDSILLELQTLGTAGSKGNFGSVFYKDELIKELDQYWQEGILNDKEKFLVVFNKVIKRVSFIPGTEKSAPTYDGETLDWIVNNKKASDLTNKDLLQILKWEEDKLESR